MKINEKVRYAHERKTSPERTKWITHIIATYVSMWITKCACERAEKRLRHPVRGLFDRKNPRDSSHVCESSRANYALSRDDMMFCDRECVFRSRWCSVRQLTLDETQTAIDRSLRAVQSICDAVNSKNINAYRPTRYKTRYIICMCWGRREFFSIIKRDFRGTKEEIPNMANGKWIIARVILDRCVFLSFFLFLSKPIVLYDRIPLKRRGMIMKRAVTYVTYRTKSLANSKIFWEKHVSLCQVFHTKNKEEDRKKEETDRCEPVRRESAAFRSCHVAV